MTTEDLESAISSAEEAAARAEQAAERAEEATGGQRHTRDEPAEKTPLTVSINSPHTVSVMGNAVALRISNEPSAGGGGGNGDTTVVQNVGAGDFDLLIDNSNVQAKTIIGHSDGSVTITESEDASGKWLVFQATPGIGNSYPVAINECPSVGGTDTELTPAVVRLKFIGRLFDVTEPVANVVHVTGDFRVIDEDSAPFTDINTLKFVGAGVLATDLGLGVAQVEVLKYPIAVFEEITSLSSGMTSLKFAGRLTTATAAGDAITLTTKLLVGVLGEEDPDVYKITFSGAGVTIGGSTGHVTVTIPGGGAAIPVFEEASQVTAGMVSLKFVGETVTATAPANAAIVTMQELDFRWNVNGAATLMKVAAKNMGSP